MPRLKKSALVAALGLLFLVVGLAVPPPKQDDVLKRLASYRYWTRVNAHPARMDPAAAILCSYQPGSSVIYQPPIPGSDPHKDHYVTVYVNDVGKRAMMGRGLTRFPVGSIIVKEKLSNALPTRGTPELLTVMIKRKKDFNPKVGNWEFLLVSGDAKSIGKRGKLESCQNCHLTQAKQDYVYGTYKQD